MLYNKTNRSNLSPIIKWAGGKEKEIKYIIPNTPSDFKCYYEPFVGGGSVFTSFNANHHYINDKSQELINLYNCIAEKNTYFYKWLNYIIIAWESMLNYVNRQNDYIVLYKKIRDNALSDKEIKAFVKNNIEENKDTLLLIINNFDWHKDDYISELNRNICSKLLRMHKIELERNIMPDKDIYENIETAFMGSLYMYFRKLYNDKNILKTNLPLATALFVFIRNYSYSGMFRYNDKGEFNVPYGGIAYNKKSLKKKKDYYLSSELTEHFGNTTIANLDFEEFFKKFQPNENDFVFLDPPYDSEFSTYAQNQFTKDDQKRLADYLINRCKAKWMMIIKNTPFIY